MPGGDKFFVDTNVLLYSLDASYPAKQRAARLWLDALWGNGVGVLSWQVLQEFYINAVRKTSASKKLARQMTEDFAQWRCPDMTIGLIRRAWHWTDEAQLSFWDGLILAAAERMECAWLISEDFQTGRRYGHVTVLSPFERSPADFGLQPRSGR